MLRKIDNKNMGRSDLGWLKSIFHFSFSNYYNPDNVNFGETTSRFLQIWLLPDKKGLTPNYGDQRFKWEDRKNKWLQIVSITKGDAPIKINQDANIYVVESVKIK